MGAGVLRNPATGKEICELKEHSAADLAGMVAASRKAQAAWAALSLRERARRLLKMKTDILMRADEIAMTISRCTGKSFLDAHLVEVMPAALSLAQYAKMAPRLLKPRRIPRSSLVFYNKSSVLYREPWGVVGIISPWNYPLGIPFHEVVMALAAGNGVVLKVATQVQPVGEEIARIVKAAGLPEGLFALAHVPGSKAGKAFIASGIDRLCFTGSVEVGKELMGLAAQRLLPISLELGGADPMIVFADANMRRSAYGVLWAGLSNAGQSCGGVQRIYVEKTAYEAFKAELLAAVKTLRFGYSDSPDCDIDVGSIATEAQRETIEAQVADALSKGARLALKYPDNLPKGNYHPAVVLEGVAPGMRLWREECFGPVLSLDSFASEDEAAAKANDSDLGLTASVWTKNGRKAGRMAARLQAGAISLNDHLMTHGMAETPWGGYKLSGIGRTHGAIGLEEMTQPKVVIQDLFPGIPKNLFWHPYSTKVKDALETAASLLAGPGKRMRLGNFLGLFLKRLGKKG
jgi:succinate-semialdehyde dehydrogenase/glutarate-semialdehyde dehydrogenase